MNLNELKIRRAICMKAISFLEGTTDPRREDALKHYQEQLARLNQKIDELKNPPPVVVGLKTAKLIGEVKK